jgi:hypothetical protein
MPQEKQKATGMLSLPPLIVLNFKEKEEFVISCG